MGKSEWFMVGVIVGMVCAIVVCFGIFMPYSRCSHAEINGSPTIVWVETDPYCYTIQNVNGVDVEMTLKEFEKYKKLIAQ